MARTKRPTPNDMPQTQDIWLLKTRKLRAWIGPEDGPPNRPYLILVFNHSQQLIQGLYLEDVPKPARIKKALFSAIVESNPDGLAQPGRPAKVLFDNGELRDALAPTLSEIGVDALNRPSAYPELDDIVDELEARMREGMPEIPGLLSVQGATVKLVAAFFEASAAFYRAAPWIVLGDEDVLAIRVLPQKDPIYVTVMGQAGITYGLSVHNHWSDIERMFALVDDPLEMLPDDGMHSMNFSEVFEVPFDDLEDIEKYGWSIAAPNAYPTPLVYTQHGEVLRPTADQLIWFEAVLRALPEFVEDFVSRKPSGELEPVDAEIRVVTSAGTRKVAIEIANQVLQTADMAPWESQWDEGEDFPLPFDRRALEGDLAHLLEDETLSGVDMPVRKAQDLMYQAWDEPNTLKRILLAHQALEISEDCADAYVLLAEEEAGSLKDAFSYFKKGVDAGKRALGSDYFEENRGYFWGLVETRPYMRAMAGYAHCLWKLNYKDESLESYQDMLHLNPSDNQGIRYVLVDLYLGLGKDTELEALLKQFKDDWSAVWLYTQALLAFRKRDPSAKAEKHLKMALEQNFHVVDYLTGNKRIPKQIPEVVQMGGDSEAVNYAANHLNYWRRTPGAVEWLQQSTNSSADQSK